MGYLFFLTCDLGDFALYLKKTTIERKVGSNEKSIPDVDGGVGFVDGGDCPV